MLGVHLQRPVDDVVLVSGSAIVTWMTTMLTMPAIAPSCELACRLAVCIDDVDMLAQRFHERVDSRASKEVCMKLFELLPCVDLPGNYSLAVTPPTSLAVKQALVRLEKQPSQPWRDAVHDLEMGRIVRLEVSLEDLALLLERVDYSSGRLEDIEATKFWKHLEASSELLEALGYEWTNQFGFDCHDSFSLAWYVPEGMVGYLAWLARGSRSVASLPEELRHRDARCKLIDVATRLMDALAAYVN